jgi:bud emergence protein 1
MHDFNAERPDELDCRRGDAITVVAQSNREWFVAKPIGKLGRPGLIPVSFVEIHDPTTGKAIVDLNALMDRGDLPKVEEWKRAMLTYKQNSISLGVIDPPTMGDSPNSFMYQGMQQRELPPAPEPQPEPEPEPISEPLPDGILLSADVVSFHYEMEEYWFRVDAVFQPYASRGQPLPPAKQLILFRIYEDFYEFQVTLLHTFPREAGQEPPYPRILPFMPGPAKDVDDALTATRRDELNDYIHGLCALAYNGGRQILEHEVLRQFLALKPGDVMHETDPRVEDIEALPVAGRKSSNGGYPGQDYPSDVSDKFGRMQVQDNRRNSDGSEYEDEGYAPSPQPRSYDKHPYGQSLATNSKSASREDTLRVQAHTQNHHQRSGSSTSFHTQHTQSYTSSHSRSHSRERLSPRASPNPPSAMPRYVQENGHSQQSTPSTTSFRSPSQSNSRSRSQSTATMNTFSSPPISAANPQTAFVKIKIFDRVADDLIAIRVHPKVSHSELMDKVQSRLGNDCRVLKYRDSLTNTFVGLDTDEELKGWMEGTDKHVLYAD